MFLCVCVLGEGVVFFFSCCYFLYFGLLVKKSILGISRVLTMTIDFSILVGVESNQFTAQMIKLWTREVNQNKCGHPAG